MAAPEDLTIGVASDSQRRDAIELVLRPLAAEARSPLLDSLATAPPHSLGPLDALIVASRRGHVVAASWAQPSPGKAAAVWPPEWATRRPANALGVEAALVRSVVEVCDASRVAMTQVLLEQGDDGRTAALESAGFATVATLEYLGRSVGGASSEISNEELSFEAYGPGKHQRLKRLLERTYIDSLDCPALGRVRGLDDVLAGYRATGRYNPNHWLIAVDGEANDVGVLLLAEHPDADQTELIYLGVPPESRGCGIGKRLVDRALREARTIGSDHLMVAVDRANAPAREIYDRAGFARWATRHVWVRARHSRPLTSS